MTQDGTQPGSQKLNRLIAFVAFVLLLVSTASLAGDGDKPGDLPDLARPSEMPTILSTPTVKSSKPVNPGSGRAVLALPGITTPGGAKPSNASHSIVSTPDLDAPTGGLQLDAPLEMKGASSPTVPANRTGMTPAATRTAQPLVLESLDQEPVPIDGPAARTTPAAKKPATTPRIEPQTVDSSQKRTRFFGLFPAPAPALARPSIINGTTSGTGSGSTGRTNPPARTVVEKPGSGGSMTSESAVKKQIEKQARDLVGDRARLIDVRIVGKVAVIQARGVKLFQKRGVRKSLESMPAINGMKTSIEVLD